MKCPVTLSSTAVIALRMFAGATLGAPVSADQFPFDKPAFRYTPFQNLDTTVQTIAEEKLGYISLTWNNHGLAPVEKTGWDSLTSNEREGAELLGYTADAWDCFLNHYEDSTWDELADKGAQIYFERLGWTRAHWEYTAPDLPYTEGRWWGQLTDNEKAAANGLCFFEDNWVRMWVARCCYLSLNQVLKIATAEQNRHEPESNVLPPPRAELPLRAVGRAGQRGA